MSDKNQELSEIFKSLNNSEGGVVSMEHAREAILIERQDLPEVALPDGSTLQVLQVDFNNNLWIVPSNGRTVVVLPSMPTNFELRPALNSPSITFEKLWRKKARKLSPPSSSHPPPSSE